MNEKNAADEEKKVPAIFTMFVRLTPQAARRYRFGREPDKKDSWCFRGNRYDDDAPPDKQLKVLIGQARNHHADYLFIEFYDNRIPKGQAERLICKVYKSEVMHPFDMGYIQSLKDSGYYVPKAFREGGMIGGKY
jgi:hypothetical protein